MKLSEMKKKVLALIEELNPEVAALTDDPEYVGFYIIHMGRYHIIGVVIALVVQLQKLAQDVNIHIPRWAMLKKILMILVIVKL